MPIHERLISAKQGGEKKNGSKTQWEEAGRQCLLNPNYYFWPIQTSKSKWRPLVSEENYQSRTIIQVICTQGARRKANYLTSRRLTAVYSNLKKNRRMKSSFISPMAYYYTLRGEDNSHPRGMLWVAFLGYTCEKLLGFLVKSPLS